MGLPAFSQWICHFFAELSQVGCRTRGVEGRLFHARSDGSQRFIFFCHIDDHRDSRLDRRARGRPNLALLCFVIAPWAARCRANSLRLAQAAAKQQTQKETQQQLEETAARANKRP